MMHIDFSGIILAPLRGRIIRDIRPDDLSEEDLEFIRALYGKARKE